MKGGQSCIFQHLLLQLQLFKSQLIKRNAIVLASIDCPVILLMGEYDLLREDVWLLIGRFGPALFAIGFIAKGSVAGVGGVEGAAEHILHAIILLPIPITLIKSPHRCVITRIRKIRRRSPLINSSHSCHRRHRNFRCPGSVADSCSEELLHRLPHRKLVRICCFISSYLAGS